MKIIEHDYSYSNRILKFMFRRNTSTLFIQNISFISNKRHQLFDKSYTHHLFWWKRFLSVNVQHIVLFSVDLISWGESVGVWIFIFAGYYSVIWKGICIRKHPFSWIPIILYYLWKILHFYVFHYLCITIYNYDYIIIILGSLIILNL